MRLADQNVEILLTEAGREIVRLALIELADSELFVVSVQESEELGLWIRIDREGQEYLFLLMWQYIDGIYLLSGAAKNAGLMG